MSALTENEKYWLRIYNEDREKLDKIVEDLSSIRKPSAEDKRLLKTTKSFVDFLDLILKYRNLSGGEHLEVSKKLIRVKSNISTKELTYRGEEFVIMNGLYIVSDVIFLDGRVGDLFYNSSRRMSREELGIPENVALKTLKLVEIGDKIMTVALLDDNKYIDRIEYSSKWDYPIF